MELFEELQKAISNGDNAEVERIQRKILLEDRDDSIDEGFINSIKGKTLCKNIYRIASGERDFTNEEYMKIVSSLITHNIIESEQTGKSMQDYPIKELYVILGKFINEGNGDAADECKRFIQERYVKFL